MEKKDYKVYKLIMRCIEITDYRSQNANVKNLRVSLNKCKRVKASKGLTLKDLRGRKEYIDRRFVLKVDYSDIKEEKGCAHDKPEK